MPGIESRIQALAEILRRRQEEQAAPVDGLSASLFDFQQELAVLDDEGRAGLLEVMNQGDDDGTIGLRLTIQDIKHFIANYGGK